MPYYAAVGPQFRVNGVRTGSQNISSATALEDGGYLLVWGSVTGTVYSLKAQRFDSSGGPASQEFTVATLGNSYQSLQTGSAGLGDGGFVIVFESTDPARDGSGSAIVAQRYDAAGQAAGAAFVVNDQTSGNQSEAAVTALADGRFVISWTTAQPASGGTLTEVKARIFDSAGAPAGAEFLVNTTTTGAQAKSSLTATASGGFILTWVSGTSVDSVLNGQIFDSAGSKVGGEIAIAGAGAGYPTEADVLALPDGRFVVAWRNYPDTGFINQAIRGQMFDASGTKIGGDFLISAASGQVGSPQLEALPDGGFVATWSAPSTSFSSGEVFGRRYDSSGAPGASFLINTTFNQSPGSSKTLVTAGGDIVTAWSSSQDFGGADVSARIFALNKAPVIQSDGGGAAAAFTVAGGQSVVTQIVATDRVGPAPIGYAITGGADSALFAIDSTGHLTFLVAPDPGAPSDSDLDNVYEVVVSASDGELSDSQALSVTVGEAGRGLLITSSAEVAAPENTLAVTRVTATDAAATFAITGGADAERFTVDATTGVLSFVLTPDFESPADAGANNVYDVEVTASAAGQSVAQALAVALRNVNEGTAFTSPAVLAVWENSNSVAVAAVDTEGDPVSYRIDGGADAGKFFISSTTGVLSFYTAPNYEVPDDVGGDRVYDVVIRASDGDIVTTQAFQIAIGNVGEGPAIHSNGGGPTASLSLAENQTVATTVVAGDPPAGTSIVYSIAGGWDSSKFTIDATTGVLSFITAPNFEAPTDHGLNKIYEVTVKATAGGVSDTQDLSIAITNVNEPFSITGFGGSVGTLNVQENSNSNWIISTDEQDAGTLTFTIVGGEDAARFKLGPVFGNQSSITWLTSPNFENPTDADGDNVYYVTVQATDGTYSDVKTIAVKVADVQEPVRITSLFGHTFASTSMAENELLATTVVAVDPDNGAIAYSISGGADAAKFSIDSTTGALSFVAAPDFEIRSDSGADNVYDVIVRASDGVTSATQSIAVRVNNVIEPFSITSHGGGDSASLSMIENGSGFMIESNKDFTVKISDGGVLTYSIVGGADAARFKIGTVIGGSGTISFVAAPNFEAPADSNGDNVYQLIVQVAGGGYTDTQTISVTVTNLDESPVITSFFGGTSAVTSVNENTKVVTTVAAADPEKAAITYSISGGADAAKFTIDAATGILSFVAAPNFETRTDAGLNNVYDVIVRASDGFLTDTQAIAVSVLNVNEAPVITSNGGGDGVSLSVSENTGVVTTVTSTDPENTARTYSIAGGADSARFAINSSTGVLSFLAAPDYDNPGDAGADNVYDVIVRASDGLLADTQTISVAVTGIEEAPVITSNGGGAAASLSVGENGTAVTTVVATDPEKATRTYSISGGADAAFFAIDSASGVLTFVAARDFESPADAGGNNVYDVVVQASDGALSDSQALAVRVVNVNESPVITSGGGGASLALSLDENMLAVMTVTSSDPDNNARSYSIAGGADAARFRIDAVTGVLSFVTAPDFDNPGDAGGDNVYDVLVRASDGSLSDTQAIAVTVAGVEEAPVIASNGGGAWAWAGVSEGDTLVTTVAATDAEGAARTYSIAGGADAADFTIDPVTGALSFVEAPDFEAPGDADGDNYYEVVVEASDGALADTQALTVDLYNVNEAVAIVSDGGGASAAVEVEEDSSAVTIVQATDVDGDTLTFEISGGADSVLFTIDAETGALSFLAAPDFEAPEDSDGDNVYEVVVRTSDGLLDDVQAIAVTVTDANEAPVIASNDGGDTALVAATETHTFVTTVAAADPEGTARTYSIAGGADATAFTIDPVTGALSFAEAPDFETPGDASGDNVYEVVVSASDGSLTDTQALTVGVANVNEGVAIVSNGGGVFAALAVAEAGVAVTTVQADDVDGDAPTYEIFGGADAALFTIDSETGALSFLQAPDFEAPGDSDGDNIYEVTVLAGDGHYADLQVLWVSVTGG
ncbi:MAG TPA: hypothetical protein VD846_10785 [Allosphingosinicella sp.]|nr:hypothetical protein [Allosphingosinicella sp.]